MKLIQDLNNRNLINNITSERLPEIFQEPRVVYCGFDPTGDSLHLGNLVSLVTLKRFQDAGHKIIALIGGATGMIGDPSGRSEERQLLDNITIQHNLRGIEKDIRLILREDVQVVNNADWVSGVDLISFLRDFGKSFRVNTLLQMTSIKDRLDRQEGISFTEFTYPLIQALDFMHLRKNENCILQIGGSDQWGNITGGIELTRKMLGEEVFGLTLNLLLDEKGNKFGKSTGERKLFLDPHKTDGFEIFQHFTNVADSEIENLLKVFSCKTLSEIEEILQEHTKSPGKRIAQKALAEEMTLLLRGDEGLQHALSVTEILFGHSDEMPDERILEKLFNQFENSRVISFGTSFLDALLQAGLIQSKNEGKNLIKNGGITLNNQKVRDFGVSFNPDKTFHIVRVGKKKKVILKIKGKV